MRRHEVPKKLKLGLFGSTRLGKWRAKAVEAVAPESIEEGAGAGALSSAGAAAAAPVDSHTGTLEWVPTAARNARRARGPPPNRSTWPPRGLQEYVEPAPWRCCVEGDWVACELCGVGLVKRSCTFRRPASPLRSCGVHGGACNGARAGAHGGAGGPRRPRRRPRPPYQPGRRTSTTRPGLLRGWPGLDVRPRDLHPGKQVPHARAGLARAAPSIILRRARADVREIISVGVPRGGGSCGGRRGHRCIAKG